MSIKQAAAVVLTKRRQVWLGRRGKTRFLPGFYVFPGGAAEDGETFPQTARRELREETGLELGEEAHLRPFARAITPAYSKYRFDVRVYHLPLPEDMDPEPDGFELVSGRWLEVDVALRKWEQGELPLAPPTLRQIRLLSSVLEGERAWPEESEAFADPPLIHRRVLPFAPGITVFPIATNALPPATWTNCVLLGENRLLIVDPGGPDLHILREQLEWRVRGGAQITGVLLTHHHPDHLDGYGALGLEEQPLFCHRETAPLLPETFPTPQLVEDGTTWKLEKGLTVVFHHTPGHAPGHLALEVPERKTILAADMISSLSSIVIPEKTGDLHAYLLSLERLSKVRANLIIPSHGPPYGLDSDPFGRALLHRRRREEQVLRALSRGAETVDRITELVYPRLQADLLEPARCNVRHYLEKLKNEGKARCTHRRWALTGGGMDGKKSD